MKLNVRFLLITVAIVLIISISSMFIFYSLASQLLQQQQSKSLLSATTSFVFALQSELQKTDEQFKELLPQIEKKRNLNIDSTSIDFLFTLVNDSLINLKELKVKSNSYVNIRSSSFQKFFTDNKTLVLRFAQQPNGETYYYGRMITSDLLSQISGKIKAEAAILVNDSPIEVSNPDQNQIRLLSVVESARELKQKNNFDIYYQENNDADFVSAIYTPRFLLFPNSKVSFVVFQSFREGAEFRNTLRIVMILIILAGSAITFIIVIASTVKLRKQISLLSAGAEETRKGNLDHRVPVLTKDEIGHFAETFNKMLEELVRNKNSEKEYSEFIALINQNPTLKEISDSALSKIIKTTHLAFGALYLVEKDNLRLISSHGISKNFAQLTDMDLYHDAVEKKEPVEFNFTDNFPEIKTGITSIKIKYLVIHPIVYNKETIAVLELASENKPESSVEKYITTIQEQLAIGLVNAKSFEQLENLVSELKTLNDEYQKQNTQIVEQNNELKELHGQLKDKADELEKQRVKAVELSKVKSEFLASMSHELRTPLISILGLTELMQKDSTILLKVKERLNIINRNGKKLLGLINNILEFSKFESGKIDVKKETFILSDMIDELKQNVFPLAVEKNLKLHFEIPERKTVLLNSDKDKIEQILQNLLVNAIKFTEQGYVKVKAGVKNNIDLEISVEDTGIGIDEEDQKKIFGEFKQVDGSTSRKYGGAGLGLAICKKYVELLGGFISLQSKLGSGSLFSFIINEAVLDIIENNEHKFLSLDSEINSIEVKLPTRLPVLIVTASYETEKLFGGYLSSYNVKYDCVNSCSEAEKELLQKKYSAVILNPFKDSLSLITKIKLQKSSNNLSIIIAAVIEEKKFGWKANIDEFVVGRSEILNTLEKYSVSENEICIVSLSKKEEWEEIYSRSNSQLQANRILFAQTNEELISLSQKNNFAFIIVDVESLGEKSFDVCYTAQLSKAIKNAKLIFLLPEELSKIQSQNITDKFEEIILKIKLHPLDILKELRDDLNLEESAPHRKITLIEETTTEQNKTTDTKTKPTILIVDDDDDALFTVGEFVKELQYDAIYAHNGMECLLMLNHVVPDLILLDIMMPQMDGFETIKRIRNDNRFVKIPVIALTAYAMLDNKSVIEKNGFDDLVTKPINSQTLSAKILKYLS